MEKETFEEKKARLEAEQQEMATKCQEEINAVLLKYGFTFNVQYNIIIQKK